MDFTTSINTTGITPDFTKDTSFVPPWLKDPLLMPSGEIIGIGTEVKPPPKKQKNKKTLFVIIIIIAIIAVTAGVIYQQKNG